MTQDEAKAIIDGGMQYLIRQSRGGSDAVMLTRAAGYDFPHAYIHFTDNGADGNMYTSNDFQEIWERFEQYDTPISPISTYKGGWQL